VAQGGTEVNSLRIESGSKYKHAFEQNECNKSYQ